LPSNLQLIRFISTVTDYIVFAELVSYLFDFISEAILRAHYVFTLMVSWAFARSSPTTHQTTPLVKAAKKH
jgi:hypothetical protein